MPIGDLRLFRETALEYLGNTCQQLYPYQQADIIDFLGEYIVFHKSQNDEAGSPPSIHFLIFMNE